MAWMVLQLITALGIVALLWSSEIRTGATFMLALVAARFVTELVTVASELWSGFRGPPA